MTLSPIGHPSQYQLALNSFRIQQNQFLLQATFTPATALGQPQYAFGSDAAQMYSMSQTLAVLHQAYNSGLYGYEAGWTGTKVDTKA